MSLGPDDDARTALLAELVGLLNMIEKVDATRKLVRRQLAGYDLDRAQALLREHDAVVRRELHDLLLARKVPSGSAPPAPCLELPH